MPNEANYYIFPEELSFQDICQLTEDDRKQYQVQQAELSTKVGMQEQCVRAETYTTTCMCGNPPRPKPANCTVYRGLVSNKYCYTRCESCYVACNRP
jgi:hypothetical protein